MVTHHYAVQYTGRRRDTSRIDAMQATLRVFRDEEYFQYVVAIVSGVDLRLLGGERATTNEQLWWALCELAGRDVEAAVLNGSLPLPEATTAYEVFPSVEEALKLARHAEPIHDGGVVYEFDTSQ
jgi:hypothetical protein